MGPPVELVGPTHAVHFFGVKLVGFNEATGRKLLLTLAVAFAVWLIAAILRASARLALRGHENLRTRFFSQQAVALVSSIIFLILFVSIWFDNPGRFGSVAALISAGLAIAMQKLVMSLVGYVVILRGQTFKIGDRITMGGVRGDVVALGYIRTTIMEMGEPPAVQKADPAMWVESRQYTGRIVSVTNDKVFDQPVYNFTREFPFLFEEMRIPVKYDADHAAAEKIMLDAVDKQTHHVREMSAEEAEELARRYFIDVDELGPRVYYRLTDNWVELTVRFVVPTRHIRPIKDAISRDILAGFKSAGLDVASSTYDIVGMPKLKVVNEAAEPRSGEI